MTRTSKTLRAGAWGALLFASSALTAPALAQQLPRFNQVDANGVDLYTGGFSFSLVEGRIGAGVGELSLARNWVHSVGWTDNWSGALYEVTSGANTEAVVEFGNYSDRFTYSGGTYTSQKADGATLVPITTPYSGYLYTAADGTQISFRNKGTTGAYWIEGPACQRATNGRCAIPITIQQPSGMTYALTWDLVNLCTGGFTWGVCNSGTSYPRFRGAANSANYSFTISYATDTPGSGAPVADWYVRANAQFTNLDSAPGTLPTVTYSGGANPTSVTDIGGQAWQFSYSAGYLIGIRRPGAGANTTTIGYSGGSVSYVTREGVSTSYDRWTSGTGGLMTVTDEDSHQTLVNLDLTKERITSIFDALERTTHFAYDSNGRPTQIIMPEGNKIIYTYDARGNVTETRQMAKSETGLPDLVATASYPSSCSNPVICNLPTSTTDARGHTTDYTYNSTHGGVETVTAPAPSGSGDRPQTRTTYAQVTAVTGQPVYLPTEVSTCASGTSPSCVGTTSEARTVAAYDTDNLRVTSATQRNGDNSVAAASAFTYDAVGNLLTVDGPLSGSADTTRYLYDTARRVIGVIGPDPDGGGARLYPAERRTFTNGLLTRVEAGTVNSQSDGDWTNFAPLERAEQDYDANARLTQQRLMSGSTTYAVIQTTYDSLGRVACQAQRMNPAEFASLTSNACALDTEGTGSNAFGPDRITRTYHDAVSRVTQVATAYGVSGQEASEVSTSYTTNGRVATVTDAESNRTTYVYDGHDRLSRTRMPSPSTDNTSSTTDYEELTYETVAGGTRASPLVASRRLRDSSSIGMTYDALGRLTARDMPGSEPDATYSYDLLGRMTGASQGGYTQTFTYDALGRNLSEATYLGTASYQYDLAGRRTRLTYPGSGLYVDYDYLVTGEISAIRENGATSGAGVLGTYAYDDRGRRTSLTRGNGTVTTYGYDNVSRATQIVQNVSGTSQDLTLDLTPNPAGQIAAIVRSNDAYAWTGHYPVNRNYTANGLNQYSAAGSVTPTYDSRGNLTSAGSTTYGYNSDNMLVSAGSSVALGYYPLGQLAWTTGNPNFTRFAYEGASLIAEYDYSVGLVRRFVHGPGVDEPLVQYDISGGTTTRRWLHADERGSIVALSSDSGTVTTVNTYDEYGIPGIGNSGRFQYTAQMWLGELGMYHFRARIYSPTLGRFLQTDPIGFGGGMNIYAYVLNDPTNLSDASGLTPTYSACTGSRLCLNVKTQNGGYGGTYPAVGASVSSMLGSDYEVRDVTSYYQNGQLIGQTYGPWMPLVSGWGLSSFLGAGSGLASHESAHTPSDDNEILVIGDRGARSSDAPDLQPPLIFAQNQINACGIAFARCVRDAESQYDGGNTNQSHQSYRICVARVAQCNAVSAATRSPPLNLHGFVFFPNGDLVIMIPGRPDRFVPRGSRPYTRPPGR